MNRDSVDCVRVDGPPHGDDWVGAEALKKPGEFFWLRSREDVVTDLLIFLPGDEGGSVAPVPVILGHGALSPTRWGWNGDLEKPTLTPSIWRNQNVGRNEWHGHLTNGRLVSC